MILAVVVVIISSFYYPFLLRMTMTSFLNIAGLSRWTGEFIGDRRCRREELTTPQELWRGSKEEKMVVA
jgi:hypothetical protein